mmetsp:Transcript_94239/g.196706  ORF Transcript_94239/g.196706 Transcript_94239/m.196706 type:complete len:396 (-) Transcript_94239:500-1687(-)
MSLPRSQPPLLPLFLAPPKQRRLNIPWKRSQGKALGDAALRPPLQQLELLEQAARRPRRKLLLLLLLHPREPQPKPEQRLHRRQLRRRLRRLLQQRRLRRREEHHQLAQLQERPQLRLKSHRRQRPPCQRGAEHSARGASRQREMCWWSLRAPSTKGELPGPSPHHQRRLPKPAIHRQRLHQHPVGRRGLRQSLLEQSFPLSRPLERPPQELQAARRAQRLLKSLGGLPLHKHLEEGPIREQHHQLCQLHLTKQQLPKAQIAAALLPRREAGPKLVRHLLHSLHRSGLAQSLGQRHRQRSQPVWPRQPQSPSPKRALPLLQRLPFQPKSPPLRQLPPLTRPTPRGSQTPKSWQRQQQQQQQTPNRCRLPPRGLVTRQLSRRLPSRLRVEELFQHP